MYHFPILIVCIFFTFHTISEAEDSLTKVHIGSLDTVINATNLVDNESAEKDSALHDIDSALSIALANTHDTSVNTSYLQIEDSATINRLNDALSADKDDSVKGSDAETIIQKKAIRVISRNIKNIIRLILPYFRHFIVLIISCSLILFTIFFYRKKIDSRRFLTSTRLSVMDREVQIACKYMERHFDDPNLSIETICKEIVTGPAFLEALFDRELGMSVSEFLTQVRINRVKIILKKKPNITVEELISSIGFSDNELFLQNFKEITDLTFKEYQASLQRRNKD